MFVVLSQKIDTQSSYEDSVFKTYHYPSRYRNQLHEGDVFVYYQGNRFDKSQRYYFGAGIVGSITQKDEENYYAELLRTIPFETVVPIYLPDGGYIEQLDFETVRQRRNPPWQSSIRPISKRAYEFILSAAGCDLALTGNESLTELEKQLKTAIRKYFLEKDDSAIDEIEKLSKIIKDNKTNKV